MGLAATVIIATLAGTIVAASPCERPDDLDRTIAHDWTDLARGELSPAIGVRIWGITSRWEFVSVRLASVPTLASCEVKGDTAILTYHVVVTGSTTAAFGRAKYCKSKTVSECLDGGGALTEPPADREAAWTESQRFTFELTRTSDGWRPALPLRDAFRAFECREGLLSCPKSP